MPAPGPESTAIAAEIAANLDAVRRRISAAAQRAGRQASDVALIAVSKTFPAPAVVAAAAAGQREFGENRVQECLDKIAAASAVPAMKDAALSWHLIGHLQSTKAKKAAAACGWIHSVDS